MGTGEELQITAQAIMAGSPGRSRFRSRWGNKKIIDLNPDRHRLTQAPVPPSIGTALMMDTAKSPATWDLDLVYLSEELCHLVFGKIYELC
jgi:hypothetical protein